MVHLRRYFAALITLSAAYCAYAYGVAPLIEPPPIRRAPVAGGSKPVAVSPDLRADLARLFDPPAWELENPIVVEAEQCTLLVQEYLPTPDGRLELKPCTVIFYTQDSVPGAGARSPADVAAPAQRRPVVMQAPEGAVLQFDRPLDIARGQFGKVIGGRLNGQITIYSPPTTVEGSDALRLTTRNVQLDQNKVFTPHEVEFRYGDTYGKGRDLTITLAPEDARAGASTAPKRGGDIQSITLARIDRLHIVPPPQNDKQPATAWPLGAAAADDAPIEVTCHGPFVLDMAQQLATFDDRVEVTRLTPGGPPDRLRCDRLLIELAAEQAQPQDRIASESGPLQPSSASADRPQKSDSAAGRVERVIALGSPATLDAPSRGARASAARMEYSLVKRRIVLVPGRGAPQVSLRQDSQYFTARELEYEFAEEGRLGRMWAAGPGELKAVQSLGPAEQTVVARWEKELRIRPHEHNQVISLVGDASVTVDPMGRFDARELHLWLLEQPAEELVATDSSQQAGSLQRLPPDDATATNQKPRQPKFSLLPARLLATGSVRLTSAQLDAEAARLEAWFRHLPAAAVTPLPELPPIGGVTPASLLQPASPGGRIVGPGQPPQRTPKPPGLQKFHVNGELVQLQVVVQGKKIDLEDMLIRTNALIEETRTEEPGQEPIVVRGDSIELRHGTTAEATIEVLGKPAEVKGRGMSLAGNQVHVHRGDSRIWIDGPGEATLPVPDEQAFSLTPGIAAAGPVREPMQRPRPNQPATAAEKMHLVWQQGLTFDGQTARLAGGHEIRTAPQVALAQTLNATLTERLDFMATESRPTVELGRLELDGGVLVKNYGYDDAGQQVSFDQLKVKNLAFDLAHGTLHADGPGWGSTVRKMEGGLSGLPGAAPRPANGPPMANAPQANADQPLTCIHISFERAIDGELAKRSITFRHNVRTTYSPARDFDDLIVALRPADLGQQGLLMTSDSLTVTEMLTPGQRWMEMQAAGNTLVEGASFTARAAKVGYTSDKEVLTVEGDGRADAQIWYQAAPGQPRSYTSARKFRYWLREGTFDGEDFSVLDLQQLGNLKFGPRR